MRYCIGLILIVFFTPSFAQSWQEDVEAARKFYKSNEFKKAKIYYQKGLKHKPSSIDLTEEIAQCNYKNNAFEKARNMYSKSLQKTSNKQKIADLNYNKGTSFMKEKNYTSAIENYKKTLKINSSDEMARYNLSQALRMKNKKENKPTKQNNPPKNPADKNQKKDQTPQQPKPESNALSKNELEKKLDRISKAEAASKRKKFNNGSTSSNNSTKNW